MLETYHESAVRSCPSMVSFQPAVEGEPKSERRVRVAPPTPLVRRPFAPQTTPEGHPSSLSQPSAAPQPSNEGMVSSTAQPALTAKPSLAVRPTLAEKPALPPLAKTKATTPTSLAPLAKTGPQPGAATDPKAAAEFDPELVGLVQQYVHVVRRIAAQIHRRSPPSVQRDDLEAAGMGGLWDAVRRRGAQRDENFDYYVCTRVRGAIIDELRTEDWLPRRRVSADGSTRTSAATSIVYFEDLGSRDQRKLGGENLLDGEQEVENRMALERVMDGLARLPARERYVLLMRDVEGVPIKDLGEELGVSRPRICQLRTQALRRLREFLAPAA